MPAGRLTYAAKAGRLLPRISYSVPEIASTSIQSCLISNSPEAVHILLNCWELTNSEQTVTATTNHLSIEVGESFRLWIRQPSRPSIYIR